MSNEFDGKAMHGDGGDEAGGAITWPSLDAYVGAVAAGEATPGGGSVVAVVGALGAALAEMVANLTVGRPAYASAEPDLRMALARATALRHRLLELAAADEAAYGRYAAAATLPKDSDAEKATRRAAMQAALVGAADVPLAVAEAAVDLLDALEPIARLGNKHVLSDAMIGAHLAKAAVAGALLNVRGNARMMTDGDRAEAYRRHADSLERRGEAAARRVIGASGERA